ncbi:MAG: ABC transporter substrate-binding protein [Micromonosporaceae bacterium]
MRNTRTRLAACVTAAVMLFAGGCSGSGSSANSDGLITVGVITSLSGQYSVLGGFIKKTLDLQVESLNKAGGIEGRKVKLEYADDQTNPTQAAIALRKLSQKQPAAIVGPVLSSACAAIVDKVDQLKIPMLTTCATDSQVNPVRDYTFMSTLSTPAMVEQITAYLAGEGKSKIAVLHDTTDFGKSGMDQFGKQDKVKVVARESYELKSTSFVPQLSALGRSDADAVVVWGAGPPLVTITKEYKQLGADVPLLFSGAAATPLYLQPAGAAADGVITASSLSNVVDSVPDSNKSKAIVTELAKNYQDKYGKPISQFTADACGAWKVIEGALKKAGSDPEAVRDAIEENPAVGCHGTYDYSAKDHRGLSAKDVWITTVDGGSLTATDFSKNNAG